MKICLFTEGSYPYTAGGVASWVQMLVKKFSDVEFVLHTIGPTPDVSRKFKYELPPNVTAVRESFLVDSDRVIRKKSRSMRLPPDFKDAMRSLIMNQNVNWGKIFECFHEYKKHIGVNSFLIGPDFYDIVREYYDTKYHNTSFSDFLWTFRSMYLPVLLLLKADLFPADGYHTLSTGYAGILSSAAKHIHKKPLILSEHGIYTREREEEIIKADWTRGIYKDIWIKHFYEMSNCCYAFSDKVVSLFEEARELEVEIGCDRAKTMVIENGINYEAFQNLPDDREPDGFVNIAAILRIAPIKDVKTMITAFHYAKKQVNNIRLYIMGPMEDDTKYYEECLSLIEKLGTKDVIFTGRVNLTEYLGRMDINILTSISEGQPLSLMEAMAAGIPSISTRVGNCEGILIDPSERYRPCGIAVPIMNVNKIADAIVTLASDTELRREMGRASRIRARDLYKDEYCIKKYRDLYNELF